VGLFYISYERVYKVVDELQSVSLHLIVCSDQQEEAAERGGAQMNQS